MTQHLADGRWADSTDGTLYHTVCGRWVRVISAQANGPSGVTCKSCKRAMEAGQ